MAIDPWKIVQKVADDLPPYLEDSDLTAERFYQKNKDKMSSREARAILERMVEEGILVKQDRRRRGKSGTRAVVYVAK
jgi:hypothetical protein